MRRPDGLAEVEMPLHRHVDGELVPSIVAPEELEDAIARAVLERVAPRALVVAV